MPASWSAGHKAGRREALAEVVNALRVEATGEGWMPDAFRLAARFVERKYATALDDTQSGGTL